MLKLFEEYIDIRCSPKNLKPEDEPLFSHEFSKRIPATVLRVLNNVIIYDNLVFDKRKFFVSYIYRYLKKLSPRQKAKKIFHLSAFPKKIDKAIWITDELSQNYFHWLTDALPRLLASEKHIKEHLILLSGMYGRESFVTQSLEILNSKAFFFEPVKNYKVTELLVPGYTAPTGNYNKTMINSLRERFISENKVTPFRKIYISRQKATKRKIINEDKVISLFKEYRFEIHFFEDYNFKKQVQLAQQASHLAGLHGAGLTNMLFMQAAGKIFELRQAGDDHNNCYFSLASVLGYDYFYLLSGPDGPDPLYANITVDIDALKIAIENIIA